MFIVSALSNMNKIKRAAIRKLNHLSSCACWCIVLQEDVKVKLSPQVCKSDHFGRFCGYNVKTLTVWHQWTRKSLPSTQGSYSASLSAPVATSQFVLAAHYDVSITSRLAKNI